MSNATERLLTKAKELGVSRETIERFIGYGYIPQERGLEFHALARGADSGDYDQIGYGGTRGQAKTHAVLCQVAMDDCIRYPGLKWLYLRMVLDSAREQFNDLRLKILHHPDFADYVPSSRVLRINNGSIIIFGGYRSTGDIAKYIGQEYDGIIIEDATTIPEDTYLKIRGSLRTSKPNWRPRIYAPANPGGSGHNWYKDTFVKNPAPKTRYLHTQLGDNVFIDKGYEDYLNSLKGRLGKMWRDGSWDVDIEGALWSWELIEASRINEPLTEFEAVIVAIDPAVSSNSTSNETGIVVVGRLNNHYYVIADYSGLYTPNGWASKAVWAYDEHSADRIVAETNQGGAMVESTIRNVRKNISYKGVRASKGKYTRAEPISALWETGAGHIIGTLPELEQQLTSWTPGEDSPDRLDAMVWGITALIKKTQATTSVISY